MERLVLTPRLRRMLFLCIGIGLLLLTSGIGVPLVWANTRVLPNTQVGQWEFGGELLQGLPETVQTRTNAWLASEIPVKVSSDSSGATRVVSPQQLGVTVSAPAITAELQVASTLPWQRQVVRFYRAVFSPRIIAAPVSDPSSEGLNYFGETTLAGLVQSARESSVSLAAEGAQAVAGQAGTTFADTELAEQVRAVAAGERVQITPVLVQITPAIQVEELAPVVAALNDRLQKKWVIQTDGAQRTLTAARVAELLSYSARKEDGALVWSVETKEEEVAKEIEAFAKQVDRPATQGRLIVNGDAYRVEGGVAGRTVDLGQTSDRLKDAFKKGKNQTEFTV